MTISDYRRDIVLGWARAIIGNNVFNHYLAVGCEACELIRKQVRMVVRWAMTATEDVEEDWEVALDWVGTSAATLRAWYMDSAVRGSWLIAIGGDKLARLDPATGRPKAWAEAPTMGAATDYQIDQHIVGW